jgi:hypothetical protein
MIIDKTNGKLDEAKAFADRVGKRDNLDDRLEYLGNYARRAGRETRCTLYNDFTPHSFEFLLEEKKGDEWVRLFNGGLIYHGPLEDGSKPETFSVQLTPTDGWSVHT